MLATVHKPLQVIHTANHLSKVWAVFSWPIELGILSREMVTSSAQILCKAYASSSCFLFVLAHRHGQRLLHRCTKAQMYYVAAMH